MVLEELLAGRSLTAATERVFQEIHPPDRQTRPLSAPLPGFHGQPAPVNRNLLFHLALVSFHNQEEMLGGAEGHGGGSA